VTIKEALHQAAKTLTAHAIDDASLEAELILMHLLGIERAHLYTRLEEELSPGDGAALAQLICRRLAHEPLAYIIGHREFFGHDFHVAPGVLIPRAESELLVEEAVDFMNHRFPKSDPLIAEIGTGSGAIAISLALLLPRARVYATDISPRALEIAAINCERHKVRVHLLEGDLLAPLPEPVDIIIANLPYIRDGELNGLSAEIRMYEPVVALAGGGDGLDKMRQLLVNAPEKLRPGGVILLEIGPAQGPALTSLAKGLFSGAEIALVQDLSGVARVLKVILTKNRVEI